MQFRAMKGKVLLRPAKQEETKQGDIIIPATKKADFHESGEVLAVASDVDGVKVGDEVLFTFGAGIKLRLPGVEILAVAAHDLCAVVES